MLSRGPQTLEHHLVDLVAVQRQRQGVREAAVGEDRGQHRIVDRAVDLEQPRRALQAGPQLDGIVAGLLVLFQQAGSR